MNIKDITKLAEIMDSKGLSLIEIEEDGGKIKMERAVPQVQLAQPVVAAPVAPATVPHTQHISGAHAEELIPVSEDNGNTVKSPTVGVFYAAASPDSDSFVQVGSKVKKGDVLCIIEAMKLMNEITSEFDGEVVEVCIGNGQVVEFGQPLFKIK